MISDSGFRREQRGLSFSLKLLNILHMDPLLLLAILLLTATGLGVLYSAGDQSIDLINRQATRLFLAFLP